MHQQRWNYLIGLLILVLALAACGEDKNSDSDTNNEAPDNSSDTTTNDAVSIPDNDSSNLNFDLGGETVQIEPQSVQAGEGTLLINVTMPEGYKFNDLAPFRGDFVVNGTSVSFPDEWTHYEEILPTMPLEVPVTFTEGQATVTADLHIYWCEAINETLCFVDNQILTIPITVDNSADSSIADAVVALIPPE